MPILKRTAAFLLLSLLLLPLVPEAQAGHAGRLYRQRLEVGRALIEVQSINWPTVMPYYTDDIEYHDPVVDIYGHDMMTQFLARMFANSPDLVTTIEDETLAGDTYSATWTMVGQFGGVPYSAKGITILKFARRSAQVYYQRDYYTEGDIMANIPGLDEAIGGFRTYYRCVVDPTFDCPLEEDIPDKPTIENSLNADKCWDWIPGWFGLRRARLQIGRGLVEINAGNFQSLLPYYADDIEYHDPIVDIYGIETMVPFLGRLFAGSPDLVTTVEDESLVGPIYTATWTMAGTLNGVPFSAKGMSIVKFRPWSRKVYYSRDYYTEGDIMANIPGLDEALIGFRTYYRCAVDPTFDCPLAEGAALDLAGKARPEADRDTHPATTFGIRQNVPNPFNPSTEISFVVPESGATLTLRIYDMTGKLVRTLVDGYTSGGTHTVSWHGRNDRGIPVSSGTYFYQITAPTFSQMKKMVLLK